MKAAVTTLDAGKAGEIELADAIFGLEVRPDLIHRMVRYQTLKRMAGRTPTLSKSCYQATGGRFTSRARRSRR